MEVVLLVSCCNTFVKRLASLVLAAELYQTVIVLFCDSLDVDVARASKSQVDCVKHGVHLIWSLKPLQCLWPCDISSVNTHVAQIPPLVTQWSYDQAVMLDTEGTFMVTGEQLRSTMVDRVSIHLLHASVLTFALWDPCVHKTKASVGSETKFITPAVTICGLFFP